MGCDLFTCNRLPCQGKDGTVSGRVMPCQIGSAPPGGAGSARPDMRLRLDRGMGPLGHRLIVKPPVATQCVGIRTAVPYGRGDRAPPRKPPSALYPGLPRKAIPARLGPPGRGGLRTPAREGIGLTKAWPRQVTGRSFAPDDHVMPRHWRGLATRTHRVRPSEKTTARVIPRFSPLGHPSLDSPPRGGAGSARPRGKALA
jgi:hypothetical protein